MLYRNTEHLKLSSSPQLDTKVLVDVGAIDLNSAHFWLKYKDINGKEILRLLADARAGGMPLQELWGCF